MDWIVQIVTSTNFVPIALFILLLTVVLAFMAKRGVFSIKVGGVQVGHTESTVRELLLKEIQYVKKFCKNGQQELIARERQRGYELQYMNVCLIFEKVLDEILEWLIVNNIQVNKIYIEQKTEDIKMVVATQLGKLSTDKRNNPSFMCDVYEYCEEFVSELVTGIERVKEAYNKEQR